jgi:uncharacterized LabA/DUF88 family protein
MEDEVAVFIDLENIRYGLLNYHGIEPDFQELVLKARKYGRPSVMRAYADFTEHPPELSRALQVAGIESITIPVKRRYIHDRSGKAVERVKNAADMVLALDAVMEAIEADIARQKKVFLIVSGDRDYIKLVTILRNRYGQRVIIVGIPDQVAADLIAAAGEKDLIEIKQLPEADKHAVRVAIVQMVRTGPAPLEFWSVRIIDQWAQDSRRNIPGTAKDRRDAIRELVEEEVITTKERIWKGKPVTEAILDEGKAKELKYI